MTVDVSKIIAWYDVRKGANLNLTDEEAFKMAAKYGGLTEPENEFQTAEDVVSWIEANNFRVVTDKRKFGDVLIVNDGMFIGIIGNTDGEIFFSNETQIVLHNEADVFEEGEHVIVCRYNGEVTLPNRAVKDIARIKFEEESLEAQGSIYIFDRVCDYYREPCFAYCDAYYFKRVIVFEGRVL